MRGVAALLVLSACAAESPVMLDPDGLLVSRTMRVIATPVWVQLYVDDPAAPSTCNHGHFPEPGTCVGNSDGRYCPSEPPGACLRYLALEQDGEVLMEWNADGRFNGGPYEFRLTPGMAPTHLAIRGCGGTDRVPIRTAGPQPMATATRTSDDHLHVAWTTDRPATTTIVESGFGEMCHTSATEIDLHLAPGQVFVTAMDPVERVPTIWGVVDVYTGRVDVVPVQQ